GSLRKSSRRCWSGSSYRHQVVHNHCDRSQGLVLLPDVAPGATSDGYTTLVIVHKGWYGISNGHWPWRRSRSIARRVAGDQPACGKYSNGSPILRRSTLRIGASRRTSASHHSFSWLVTYQPAPWSRQRNLQ